MARKKVVHVVEDLGIGGLERVIASIVLGLDTTRYDLEVWCLVRGGEIAEELADKGIRVTILGMKSYHRPFQIVALARLLRKSRADIIHAHGYFGSTFGRLAAIAARTPLIIAHVHTTYYGFKVRHLLIERSLSLFTDKIVCVSRAVRRFVVEVEGISEKKASLIYNGVGEADLFEADQDRSITRESLGIGDEDMVVITVASLAPHKGHTVLLHAARVVLERHGNLRFVIVGDGPLRQELESHVQEMRLSLKVAFTGQRKDVAPLLRLADLFVLPSTEREGLGIALIEAMAEGLPVVGTRLGGIPEVIDEGVNGLLVAPGNSHELAAALEGLIMDRARRQEMGRAGRRIYEQRFTAADMVQSIEALYG
jgi:glycosyltransferase involved in cell wall biosynthesis